MNATEIYERANELADIAWRHGARYDAATLVLSMSAGATSGEILGDLFQELHRQQNRKWVGELGVGPKITDLQAAITAAFHQIGQPGPRAS